MLGDITLGQFFPGKSVLHRLDPRVKLILLIVYIVMLFIGSNFYSLGLATVLLIFLMVLSRVPVKMYLKSLKPILPIVIFTSILNLIYVKGNVLLDLHLFQITDRGVFTALFMTIRIALLILGSAMLTYTTSPTDLTDGLERLLSPLKVFKVRVSELAMMMTIALRFVPTLIEETEKIMSAQKARGADMESGGLIHRVKALVPILVPLFISSFRRAYDLAIAMECRCYQGGEGRTRMKVLHIGTADVVSMILMFGLFGGNIAMSILIPSVL
ncbi:MAG: energy-coupling factor transporter transmembrane protein EcfT [Clostridiales bacterium]|nr:energy-coupling factor transporter transmembrane protein EcfT [Clostridiales bacterium]